MLYLSQLLGVPVEDPQGERVGKLIDILEKRPVSPLVEPSSISKKGFQKVSSLVLVVEGHSEQTWYVPVDDVDWHENVLRLHLPTQQLSTQPLSAPMDDQQTETISLVHEVLDKQVIDIARKKAV